uniref:cytochrome b5 domain-containing protein 1-like n=1 Tax=Vespula vulgaris TaxID=7454 RepID=UPI00223B829F|nr:cytochrome b5 domain-containing protein 1-like [Vespula vulgaris]
MLTFPLLKEDQQRRRYILSQAFAGISLRGTGSKTSRTVPYCPHGPIPDVSDYVVPSTDWRPLNKCPWWLDEKYKLGKLTKNPRPCRIINVLTKTSCVIMVCEEDTIKRIQERASLFIPHGQNYSWTFEGKNINLDGTLTENNIPDERERFVACGLPEDYYVPSIMCYYIDEEDLYESD